jgi:hypothetical protein
MRDDASNLPAALSADPEPPLTAESAAQKVTGQSTCL